MLKTIAVYGSLRVAEYNYNRFGGNKVFSYKGTYSIPGYKMYSLGSYPGVIHTNDPKDNIVVDILETPDHVAEVIDNMEIGAGYTAKTISINNYESTIYVYNGKVSQQNIVENGNWKKR